MLYSYAVIEVFFHVKSNGFVIKFVLVFDMIMKYKLVGRIGDDGQYRIADEIRRDLVKMEKEIEGQNESVFL